HVLAEDALELRRERGQRSPRALVPRIRLELDPHTAEALEGMLQHEQLRLDVGAGAPGGAREPGPANLETGVLAAEGEVAATADRAAALVVNRGEGDLQGGASAVERVLEPGVEDLGAARCVVLHQAPVAFDRSRVEPLLVAG